MADSFREGQPCLTKQEVMVIKTTASADSCLSAGVCVTLCDLGSLWHPFVPCVHVCKKEMAPITCLGGYLGLGVPHS